MAVGENVEKPQERKLRCLESTKPKFDFMACYERLCVAPQGLTIFDNIEGDELPNP